MKLAIYLMGKKSYLAKISTDPNLIKEAMDCNGHASISESIKKYVGNTEKLPTIQCQDEPSNIH